MAAVDLAPLLDDAPALAGHRNAFAHLPGPLTTGATDRELPIAADGTVASTIASRHPVLVLSPRADLGADLLRVEVTLAGGRPLPALRFAPYTPAGTPLVVVAPEVDEQGVALPFAVGLAAQWRPAAGPPGDIAVAELAGLLSARLVEGILGKLLLVLGRAHPELRATSRAILAARHLGGARDDALDRHGHDLGVRRFAERLVAADGAITTEPEREPDAAYRARLSIYRPFLQPTRHRLEELLNGPGDAADPNAGLPSRVGVAARFRVVEDDDPFAVAVTLVDTSGGTLSERWLRIARDVHLSAVGGTEPARRLLPPEERRERNAVRRRLREHVVADRVVPLAPPLAGALDLLVRCRQALGVDAPLASPPPAAGAPASRYELALGLDLRPMPDAELDALVEAATSGRLAGRDRDAAAVLAGAVPVPRDDDPAGAWLLRACGLRTVHPLATDRLYVSHLPTGGLRIDPAGTTPDGLRLRAQVAAPGDAGSHAALEAAVAGTIAALGGDVGIERAAAPAGVWSRARTPSAAASALLRAVPLSLPDPAQLATRLGQVAPGLHVTLTLDEPTSADVVAGRARARAALRRVVDALVDRRVVSVLPIVTDDDRVHLVAGVVGLPWAGINGYQHRVAGFRWSAIPLSGFEAPITPTGSEARLLTRGAPGLWAVVVFAAVRQTDTDPYELRVELGDGETLTPAQYEYVLNLLEHAHPAGIEVNTFRLRRRHVDLDGDGLADPLDPTLARSYRPFRRPR